MKIISFSGVDGSGKSTQLSKLQTKLQEEGKKVYYFHAIEFSLANKIARFFKGEKEFQPGQDKAIINASWLSVHMRQKFLLLDMLRFRCLRSRLRKEGYDYLLSDRFFYDSIINIEFLTDTVRLGRCSLRPGRLFLTHVMPRADKVFLFDIEPDTILSRDRIPEQGRDYIEKKAELYQKHADEWNMQIINANRDKESIFREVISKM